MKTEQTKILEIKNFIDKNKLKDLTNLNKLYNECKEITFKQSIKNIYENLKNDDLGCNSLIRLFSEECSNEFGLTFETYLTYLQNDENFEVVEIPDEYSFETGETDYLVRIVDKDKYINIYRLLDKYIKYTFF